jgi:hypothetical protein
MGMLDGMEDDEQGLVHPRKEMEIWGGSGPNGDKTVAGVCEPGMNWVKTPLRMVWIEIQCP